MLRTLYYGVEACKIISNKALLDVLADSILSLSPEIRLQLIKNFSIEFNSKLKNFCFVSLEFQWKSPKSLSANKSKNWVGSPVGAGSRL